MIYLSSLYPINSLPFLLILCSPSILALLPNMVEIQLNGHLKMDSLHIFK